MTILKDMLQRASKRKFADLYDSGDTEARATLDALVDRATAKYPDIHVYPTDKADLRFEVNNRVCAAIELKKRKPYLRMFLLKVPAAIAGTHLEFQNISGHVLLSKVVISDQNDLDDAMKYVDRVVQNANAL